MKIWVAAATYDTLCGRPCVDILAAYRTEKEAWAYALHEGYERKMAAMLIESPSTLGVQDIGRIVVYPIIVSEDAPIPRGS